tara:strand:+ start:1169 stop:1297 length:129 start_codon:yes stop_codon:yes gene_type:complete
MTTQEYLNYLQNLRNDFYNKGNKKSADKVQSDIDKLMQENNQ